MAAKALNFESEAWRWAVSAPPLVAGAVLALRARARLGAYAAAMRAGGPLPPDRDAGPLALAVAAYAVVVLLASALD